MRKKVKKKFKGSNLTQKTLCESLASPEYTSTSTKRKSIDAAVFNMIVKDLQPVSVVEDEGFQLLVHTLDSRYELPSRRTIMQMLPEKYSEKCEAVKEELSRQAHVALTSDLWTSRATESYLTITCHFLTSSWELKSIVLDTFQFKHSHTAENISAADKWDILSKVIAIVTAMPQTLWQQSGLPAGIMFHALPTLSILLSQMQSRKIKL